MKTYTVETTIYVRINVVAESAQAAVDKVYGEFPNELDHLYDYEISNDPRVFDEDDNEIDLDEEAA